MTPLIDGDALAKLCSVHPSARPQTPRRMRTAGQCKRQSARDLSRTIETLILQAFL